MSKKRKRKESADEDLKERLWRTFVTQGADASLDEDLHAARSARTRVEIQAVYVSGKDAAAIISALDENDYEGANHSVNGLRMLKAAIETSMARSEEDKLAYHEREMQRHATAADELKKRLLAEAHEA